ncbi:MAG: general secretion pathway protein GspK [Verrucomicrobia bacterium]|nr:general secretion pathway protein GspK [Verrucomicrobiota bacterium]
MNCLLQRNLRPSQRGSVLIIVLWIAFGLVSIALYFANSMTFELRGSDNRVAGQQAEQAIDGAMRYVNYLLTNLPTNGFAPDLKTYLSTAVPVGDSYFWLIGRTNQPLALDEPAFGLIDEASKLNLNTATLEMLQLLPGMTAQLAAAIIDWRDTDSAVTAGGAESQTYSTLSPAYNCKNAPFETVDELRLVYGATLEILYGEDTNLNGVLDPNENDGTVSLPIDNQDGRLDPGILEYVTVYSREANRRTNVNNVPQLTALLRQNLDNTRATQILRRIGVTQPGGPGGGRGGGAGGGPPVVPTVTPPIRSVLEFYIRSGMTADEFAKIESSISATNSTSISGLINVNTASEAVLACIPGIGVEKAPSFTAFRQSNPSRLNSISWVSEVLDRAGAIRAGPYLTARSYQFTADVAAVGQHGRGYRRERFVFDTTAGVPQIIFRKDLSGLGWALGKRVRQQLLLAKDTR